MVRTRRFLGVLLCHLIVTSSAALSQNMVTKEVCLSTFGMNWKTSEEAQNHLVMLAKRQAVNEIFGEFIRSITQVKDYVLKSDDIQSISTGFIRIEGNPEFSNGNGFGEICVRLTAFVTEEDMKRYEPREVIKKVCVADPRLSLGEIRQTAERQARIQAVRDFEPRLEQVDDNVVLGLMHESSTQQAGFISETTTYCVTVAGKVYPIELLAAMETPNASRKYARQSVRNIANQARISASSEYSSAYVAINIADGVIGVHTRGEWASRGQKSGAWILLEWSEEKEINKIVIYDRPNQYDHITQATILFSDNTSLKTDILPNHGASKEIKFDPKYIRWLKLVVDSANGPNAGLSEMEVYGR